MTSSSTLLLAAGAALGALAFAGSAQAACSGAGVITRIQGQPQDVIITRDGAPVAKPRVLEVVCDGDLVDVRSPTSVVLSMNGAAPVSVNGGTSYRVSGRSGQPTVAANAYNAISDKVLKDMKRQPWDVRLRGGTPTLSFGVEGLTSGAQQVTAGRRDLLVRIVGGTPGYQVTLSGSAGVVGQGASGPDGAVVLTGVDLTPGVAYRIDGTDRNGAHISGSLRVVASTAPAPSYAGIDDAEVRAAVEAADLARGAPGTWAFESEQRLHAAPRSSLDRESVYRLIESYGAGG